MKKIFITFMLIISVGCHSQDFGIFIGQPKFKIEKIGENENFENVVTGDYFQLYYTIKDVDRLLGVFFEFDVNEPSKFSECTKILLILHTDALEYAELKLRSEFPFYDNELKMYHNKEISAKLTDLDSDDRLIGILYSHYQ